MRKSDIRIIRGHHSCLIIATSETGERWIKANMFRHNFETSIRVQTEQLYELIKEFEKDNLVVEGSR